MSIRLMNEGFKKYLKESYNEWEKLESKSVEDWDGFLTDYTLYTNGDTFVCIFGDSDIYNPDNSDFDFETEDENEAYEWFDSYSTDDELEESVKINEKMDTLDTYEYVYADVKSMIEDVIHPIIDNIAMDVAKRYDGYDASWSDLSHYECEKAIDELASCICAGLFSESMSGTYRE